MTDWNAIRREFPALASWTYLNTATYGQMPRAAAEAVTGHFAHRDELACADFLEWFDDADRLRALLARFVHCQAEDIAFTITASHALAILLNGIDWRAGDRIVSLEGEFPNNLYGPASVDGVEFCAVAWDRFYDSIDSRTRLVAMSSANYMTGFRPPLAEVSKFLRERGVLFYVDATQSLGAIPFDIAEVQPSMLAVHGYKWLLCPNGSAFFYVDPELRKTLRPNVIGWRSDKGWRNVNALNQGAPVLTGDAERYEGGMLPFPLLYAMEASVRMFLEIGPERIERRVMDLASGVAGIARRLGGEPAHESHIVAAGFEGVDVGKVASELRNRGVLVSARHGRLRVSPHFYNNEDDLDRFERELTRLIRT